MSILTKPSAEPKGAVVSAPRRSLLGRASKRCLDLGGAAAGILLLSPLLLVLAAVVKLGDGGEIIHRRRVVGSDCEFDAFKFRTMRMDADQILRDNPKLMAEYSKNFKLQNDPRVTRTGAFLRKYSLDELPQLFNVLFGQMSLVGPRMITPPELEKYGNRHSLIRAVKPGLTGYWQVNGRQEVDYRQRVEMDCYYVENWSLALDIDILLKTPLKVLRGEGAY